ncbi:immunity 49 family protein [Vibrio pectenicida]|uniref:Uncharacterized protein n=1 Tax=Vibrio pectenicida TaxID=62763 RepID=A0A427TYR8_9VIBR|nr:immunity 49 family protein [Vibrio pectenicida]RSD29697.1 hypothetical protein EJA03_17780 [Vibrio pectenicida]
MRKALKSHVGNFKGKQRVYDATLKRFLKTNQKCLEDETKTRFGFETGYENQFKLFAIGHHLPSISQQEVTEHVLSAQQYLTLWQRTLTQPEGDVVPFTYQGVDFEVPARGKKQHIPSPDWLNMVFITIVAGRYHDLNALMALLDSNQVEFLGINSSLHCEIVLHMLGLKTSNDISAAIEQLTELIENKDTSTLGEWVPFHSITITLGFFDVMRAVHQQDQEGYRNAMHRALEMHKEWWTHDEDFSGRFQGYVSLPLLTAARYAYEKFGFTLDFESGYLPTYVYLK